MRASGEGFAGGGGVDEGVAVAVAADPGAEGDELGEVGEGDRGFGLLVRSEEQILRFAGGCQVGVGYSASRAAATSA